MASRVRVVAVCRACSTEGEMGSVVRVLESSAWRQRAIERESKTFEEQSGGRGECARSARGERRGGMGLGGRVRGSLRW